MEHSIEPSPDRTPTGEFAPGCRPGPGRPRKARPVPPALAAAVAESLTAEAWSAIVRKHIEMARLGNTAAARWLCEHAAAVPAAAEPVEAL